VPGTDSPQSRRGRFEARRFEPRLAYRRSACGGEALAGDRGEFDGDRQFRGVRGGGVLVHVVEVTPGHLHDRQTVDRLPLRGRGLDGDGVAGDRQGRALGSAANAAGSIDVDFTDYGVPVRSSAPTPADVISYPDLMKLAGQH
jgi:hypothetical protein